MPLSVIQQVHFLGLKDKMPLLKEKCLLFERRPGEPLPDSTLDNEALDLLTHGDDGDDDDVSLTVDDEDEPLYHDADISLNELHDLHLEATANTTAAPACSDDVSIVAEEERSVPADDELHQPTAPSIEPTLVPNDPSAEPTPEPPLEKAPSTQPALNEVKGGAPETVKEGAPETAKGGATMKGGAKMKGGATSTSNEHRHNHHIRDRSQLKSKTSFNDQFDNPASSKSYSPHLQFFQRSCSNITEDPQHIHDHMCDLYEHVVHYCFNQMSAKDGIAKHGQDAIMALFKEFSQLHNKKVFKAIKASDLSKQQKRDALYALNLIKEKRNGEKKEEQ